MFGKALQTLLKAHALHALSGADTAFAIEVLRKLPEQVVGRTGLWRHPYAWSDPQRCRAVPDGPGKVPEFLNIGVACTDAHLGTRPRAASAMIVEDDALGTSSITYRELAERTSRFAQLLRAMGVAAGDRVLVRLPNSIDYPTAFLGALKRGAIAVPTSTLLTPRRCATCCEDSQAVALVIDEAGWHAMARAARRGHPARRDHRRRAARERSRRGRTEPAERTPSRRSRLPRLHLRHDRLSEGRAPRAPLALGRMPAAHYWFDFAAATATASTASCTRASSTGPTCSARRSWTRSSAARP
jgi:non-ribosomal peptide synthetase component F